MQTCRDLEDLVNEVLGQLPRLLTLQDRDPDSPMRGCMHPAYWRDKSSEVSDMRRQEAALAFAWIWRHPFPGNRWHGDPTVLQASLRALGYWTRRQHRDGTFDEWYVNEHGYATTAFSSYAVSLAIEALGDAIGADLDAAVRASLRLAGDWLATHDDWFKTNHQAVGVAALGAIGRVLGEERFLAAARRNAGLIVQRMHAEGWSSEISGLDVGYTFLLAEYLGMHAVLTGEREFLPAIAHAFRFATDHLHPDLTTGAEYGICANPYFSRVAAVVLAPHEPAARAVLEWMDRPVDGPRDTSSTLKDDLRLARYAYQPLLAKLLHSGALERRDLKGDRTDEHPPRLPFEEVAHTRWYTEARLGSFARPGHATWVAACGGGVVRIALRDGDGGFDAPVVDRGFAIAEGRHVLRNARYSLEVTASQEGDLVTVEAPLVRAGFVMPPFWARLGLRIGTALPGGPKWTRWAIDQWRRRKGTALNQSAAGVSAGKAPVTLHREVTIEDEAVVIKDRLVARSGTLDPARIFLVVDGHPEVANGPRPDVDRRIPLGAIEGIPGGQAAQIAISRRYTRAGGRPRLSVTSPSS